MTINRPEGALEIGPPGTLATALVEALWRMGMREAFGVPGGALVPLLEALSRGGLRCTTARHESGAVFMAGEASLATRRPALAYATTGPGLCNALTGALSARDDGASVLLISGMTPAPLRGRHPIQDSSSQGLGSGALHEAGFFDEAWVLEDPAQLPQALHRLTALWSRPQGGVAHLALPLDVQGRACPPLRPPRTVHVHREPSLSQLDELARQLGPRCAIWAGHGARHAGPALRALVESAGLPVMTTPRGKGLLSPEHPLYMGVTGMGGDACLPERLRQMGVERLLVLGSRLGEMATGHVRELIPPGGLVHVDIDPLVPGASFPDVETSAVLAEVEALCRGLRGRLPQSQLRVLPRALPQSLAPAQSPVRPPALLQALQTAVMDRGMAIQVDAGNSISWSTRYLWPRRPGQLRSPGSFGSMGCATAGAVGRAIATGEQVVALVGDGALLMQSELSTAVQSSARVIYVVLNDSGLGMVEHGMAALGRSQPSCSWPTVDFTAWAQAQGAWGRRVAHEAELEEALHEALSGPGPALLDLVIDRSCPPPFLERVRRLAAQTGA